MVDAVSSNRLECGHATSDFAARPVDAGFSTHPLLHALHARVLDDLPVAIICFSDSEIVGTNAQWLTLSGLDVSASSGEGWLAAIHPEDHGDIRQLLRHDTPDGECDVRLVRPSQLDVWTRVSRHSTHNTDQALLVLTLIVVGEHRDSEARLLHRSTHDEMTDLANRGRLMAIARASLLARRGLAAMLFIDLDGFKLVNDQLGHRVGDESLIVCCRRLQATIRTTDFVGRLGGDELGVFCPDLSSRHEALRLADRIGHALSAPVLIDDKIFTIGASIGIAFSHNGTPPADVLLDRSDRAMYRAKAAGGARWATDDDDELGHSTVALTEPMKDALTRAMTVATAVGMIAAATGQDLSDARTRLDRFAAAHRIPVTQLAEMLIAHTIEVDALVRHR